MKRNFLRRLPNSVWGRIRGRAANQLTLLVLALACMPLPGQAAEIDFGFGLLKRIQKKTDPATRAKELTKQLTTDPDEGKRKTAAIELRDYDPRQHPDIIPGLVAALQKDPAPAVRITAVETLNKLK